MTDRDSTGELCTPSPGPTYGVECERRPDPHTCKRLPTRGCMAPHQFAAESPCSRNPTRPIVIVGRALGLGPWCRASDGMVSAPPADTLPPSRWPMQLRRTVTVDGRVITTEG